MSKETDDMLWHLKCLRPAAVALVSYICLYVSAWCFFFMDHWIAIPCGVMYIFNYLIVSYILLDDKT